MWLKALRISVGARVPRDRGHTHTMKTHVAFATGFLYNTNQSGRSGGLMEGESIVRERHGKMKENDRFRRGKGPLGYLVAAFLMIATLSAWAVDRATWTGSAGNGLFLDPDNWTCFNGSDEQIVGGVPAADTAITLAADVPANGWAKGRLTVNADGNIVLDVQPKGTVITFR